MHKTGRRHRHTRLPQLAKGILHVMLSNKATKQHAKQQSWRGRFSLEAVFGFRLAKHWSPCWKRCSVHHLTLLYVFSTPFRLPSLLKMSLTCSMGCLTLSILTPKPLGWGVSEVLSYWLWLILQGGSVTCRKKGQISVYGEKKNTCDGAWSAQSLWTRGREQFWFATLFFWSKLGCFI